MTIFKIGLGLLWDDRYVRWKMREAFQRGKDAAQVEAMELCQQSLEYVTWR